jgi:hypothetical protein
MFGPYRDRRYRGYVADIHENGRRLLAMINDILGPLAHRGRLLDLEEDAVNVQEAVTVACNAIVADKPDAPPIHIDIPAHLPLLKV